MIQEAKAEHCLREVVPLNIQLLDGVVHVMGQLFILGGWATALVLVRRDVRPETL